VSHLQYLRNACCGLLAACFLALPATADAGRPRLIIIALDAVPYEVVAALKNGEQGEDGVLDELRGPAAVISTFPSTTTLAMSGILEPFGLEHSPGYEARFYDRGRNEVRGGGPISYHRIPFPWRDVWDWHKGGVIHKMIGGLRPVRTSIKAIDQALDAFMRSDEPVFMAYTDATDLIGHLRRPEDLEVVLRWLDDALEELHALHPDEPFYTVLFSDHGQHGGESLVNLRKPVRRALKQAGFRLRKHIKSPSDVVIVPFGLISSLPLHTDPQSAAAVAAAVGEVEGIDLCVAAGDDHWLIAGHGSRAEVRRRRGEGEDLWHYRPLAGDPLGFQPLLAQAGSGDDGWRTDRWWFEHTKDGNYPDALYRIARAFDLVKNPASVICSLDDRAMYGSLITAIGARMTVKGGNLRYTHGALSRGPSLGFLMSDLPGWEPPPIVRFDDAMKPFAAYARASREQRAAATTPE